MRAAMVVLAAAGVLAAGCGSSGGSSPAPSQTPAATVLSGRAALAGQLAFTGTYAVADRAGTKASVRVYVAPTAYRVDVVEARTTASLYGGAHRTAVACTVGATTVCYTVAAAGAAVPAAFDAGIERVFTRDLPALAARPGGIAVSEVTPAAALDAVSASVRCFAVTHAGASPSTGSTPGFDDGTYCLDAAGLPVQLDFTSGVLTLATHGAAPTAAQLKPPAAPRPLPTGLRTTTAP